VKKLWKDAANAAISYEVTEECHAAIKAAREQSAQIATAHPNPFLLAAILASPAGDIRLGRLLTLGVPATQFEARDDLSADPSSGDVHDLMSPLQDLQARIRAHTVEQARLDEVGRLKARAEVGDEQEGSRDSESPQIERRVLKKAELIKELNRQWPGIRTDLGDASKSGNETLRAANVKQGYWDVEMVKAVGRARGKLPKESQQDALAKFWQPNTPSATDG
jgi:hypothetical protein